MKSKALNNYTNPQNYLLITTHVMYKELPLPLVGLATFFNLVRPLIFGHNSSFSSSKSCMRPSHLETSPYAYPIFLINHIKIVSDYFKINK